MPVLLRSLRKERGLTQADVAALMNLSPPRISMFEQTGAADYPSLEQFVDLAAIFGLPAHELMARAVGERVEYPAELREWVGALRDVVERAEARLAAEPKAKYPRKGKDK